MICGINEKNKAHRAMNKHPNITGTLAVLGATFSWAVGPLFIHYFSGYIDAWTQNFWRYLVAFIVLLPFLSMAIVKNRVQTSLWRLALLPAFFNIVMQSFWALGLSLIEPGFVSLLARTSLFWVILFSFIIFPEERSLMKSSRFWLGITLSVVGTIIVIVFKEGFSTHANSLGIILILLSEVAWALYAVSARKAFRQTPSTLAFSIISLYTMIGLAILALLLGQPVQIFTMPTHAIAYLIFSGFLCISIAHTLFFKAIKSIGTTLTSVIMQIHPFIVILLSMLIFTETLTLSQWLGGFILVTGSLIAILAQKKPQSD
jgi:drug/metabolite transporter (DMT)-like permease